MTNNHSKLFFAGFVSLTVAVSFGSVFSVKADENLGETGATNDQKMLWLEARDRALERKAQVEANSERTQAMMEERKDARREKLCANLAERSSKLEERLEERFQKLLDRKEKRTNIFEEKRESRDATLEAKRSERDAKREEMYAKLLERAGSDTEKQSAVTAFQSAVEEAVSARKKAVDDAISAFRSGVDAAIGARKNTMDTSIAEFKEAAAAAFSATKTSCESGADPETVRTALQSSLKSARANIEDDRQAAENVGEKVRALAVTKKAAFESAHAAFKAAMEDARADLKTAFSSTDDDSEAEGE